MSGGRKDHNLTILNEFFQNAKGDNWTRLDNWKLDPVDKRYGLTVDNEGFVIDITLPNNNVFCGMLPDSLSKLDRLKKLDLSNNKLNVIDFPKSISDISNLESLELANCNLMGSIPESITRLSNLTVLNLKKNNLTGTIPQKIGKLDKLKLLNLGENQLTGNFF
jgi:Leucine-rich repeat (LRR) protein